MRLFGYALFVGLFLGVLDRRQRGVAGESGAPVEEPRPFEASIQQHVQSEEADADGPQAEPYESLFTEGSPAPGNPSGREAPSKRRGIWATVRSGLGAPFRAARKGWDWLKQRLERRKDASKRLLADRQAEDQSGNAAEFFIQNLQKSLSQLQKDHKAIKQLLARGASPVSEKVTKLKASLQTTRDWIALLLDEKNNLQEQYPESALKIKRTVDRVSRAVTSTADTLPLTTPEA